MYLSLRVLLIFIFWGSLANSAMAQKCDVSKKRPTAAQLVQSKVLYNPKDSNHSLQFQDSSYDRDLYIRFSTMGGNTGLLTFTTSLPKKSYSPLCHETAGMMVDVTKEYYFENLWSEVLLTTTLSPGAKIQMEIYTLGKKSTATGRPEVPNKVRIPVEVFVLENAPLAAQARKQIDAAVGIWAAAGIVLDIKLRRLSPDETDKSLGVDSKRILNTYLGCSQRFDNPGFLQRENLLKLKSDPKTLGVFYVKNTTQSQAEIEFNQLYMMDDPSSVSGRTLAHEIGHILLGEGHVDGQRAIFPCTLSESGIITREKEKAPWTSGLMRAGNTSNSVEISEKDAVIARRMAISLPNATWW
jgi:hypothetical protein